MLMIAFACALVLFVNATPALAIGSTQSNPAEGETRLDEIFEKSEDMLKSDNALDADKVRQQANQGINEIQGSADVQQMNRPSNSQRATSAAEEVQQAVGKAMDKVRGKN
ncbi:MAG: hypothetical protein IGS38_18880 [Synechococcales cyanobacterium M58_A2018_015]|nr:hypothetical protein [Synechococcales cyanobacterium M58_A2018_015]